MATHLSGFLAGPTADGSPETDRISELSGDLNNTARFFSALTLLGLACVWIRVGWEPRAATPLLWAFACLAGGAAVGFLFGIPRILQDSAHGFAAPASSPGARPLASLAPDRADLYQQRVNTNLEDISDWLTKIIVGLGLVNLGKLPATLRGIAGTLADDLAAPHQQAFALALIVYFTVVGLLGGYLFTRLFLQRAFAQADLSAMSAANGLTRTIARAAQRAFAANPEAGREVTREQVEAAQQVAQVAQQGDGSLVRQQMLDLAQQYEQTRASMGASAVRTRRMEVVVTKMRTLAIAAFPLLPELTTGPTAGQRLAAIAILQVQPDASQLDWLAARMAEEQPFLGYQAAVALLAAARGLGVSAQPQVRQAIQAAKAGLGSGSDTTDRFKVLAQAEAELAPDHTIANDGWC